MFKFRKETFHFCVQLRLEMFQCQESCSSVLLRWVLLEYGVVHTDHPPDHHSNHQFQEQLKTGKGTVGDCAIHLAARKGDNDLVKLFIEAGTKVDTQNVSWKYFQFQLPHIVKQHWTYRKRARHVCTLPAAGEMRISSELCTWPEPTLQ